MKLRQGCRGWQILIPALALDRIGKALALAFLAGKGSRSVLPGLLSWAYVENRGMAFGLASGSGWILIALTALVTAALLAHLLRHPEDPKLFRAGLWMIVGGGLGNLYDRIAYGFVVDFIRLDFIDFPVFNPADVFVCAGAALAALSVLVTEAKGGKKHG